MVLRFFGLGHADQHLGGDAAGVGDALVGSGAAVEAVTCMQDDFLGVGLEGHLTLDDVVNRLQRVIAELAAAAGQEVSQADGDFAAVDVLGIAVASGQAGKMSRRRIDIGLFFLGNFVAHYIDFLSKNFLFNCGKTVSFCR